METINDRMELIVNAYFDGNKSAFATAIGIAPTSITNYIGKKRKSKPSSDLLEKIVNSLDVDAMWLLTGRGNMKRKSIDEYNEAQYDNRELLSLCKALVANYQQRDDVMNKLVSMVKVMEG